MTRSSRSCTRWFSSLCILGVGLVVAVLGLAAVVCLVWRRAPQFQVAEAHMDHFSYRYIHLPSPPSLLLRQLNLTVHIALNNKGTPSPVVFRNLDLHVSIAGQTVARIQAPGPFTVRGRGVVTLGPFTATASNVSLGEAGIRATDVHHVIPLAVSGQAETKRKVFFFITVEQTPKLPDCKIAFNIPSGESLRPFKCESGTRFTIISDHHI